MSEPNKANIRKWVEALRSGEYKQGRGQLRVGDSFCCLGVACEISGVSQWSGRFYGDDGDYEDAVLPESVGRWLGVDGDNIAVDARFVEHGAPRSSFVLTELNDVRRLSFSQIADAIEATYLTEAGDPS